MNKFVLASLLAVSVSATAMAATSSLQSVNVSRNNSSYPVEVLSNTNHNHVLLKLEEGGTLHGGFPTTNAMITVGFPADNQGYTCTINTGAKWVDSSGHAYIELEQSQSRVQQSLIHPHGAPEVAVHCSAPFKLRNK